MKRLTLLSALFILAVSSVSTAQNKYKYFLNKIEIAPESVFFFNEKDIDSIRQFRDKDSTVVFYTHCPEKFLSYYQLLDLHQIDESARNLPVELSQATNVRNAIKMVFLAERVLEVSVDYVPTEMTKSIFISSTFEYWDPKSEKGKMLYMISNRHNNIDHIQGNEVFYFNFNVVFCEGYLFCAAASFAG